MLRLLPDLRYLGAGTLLNSVGMMGEVVVLGWLALELTDSPFLVGAAMGARALPLFFVGVPAGVIADRLPRHRLLIATGAGQALVTALMGVLALTGTVSLAQLVLLTFVGGTLRGLEHAARQSYAHDVVGAAGLVSGLAILGVAMRAGWLVGSLGAGAIIARYGSGHAYLFVAAAYLAGGLTMLPARAVTPAAPSGAGSDSIWRGITSFVDAVNRDRMLLVLMMLTGGAEVLGFAHQALLPSLARDVLHTGPEGLGTLNAARAVGGILAMLASMRGFPGRSARAEPAAAPGPLAPARARRRRVGGGHRPGPARPDPDRRARLAVRGQRGPGRERPRPRGPRGRHRAALPAAARALRVRPADPVAAARTRWYALGP